MSRGVREARQPQWSPATRFQEPTDRLQRRIHFGLLYDEPQWDLTHVSVFWGGQAHRSAKGSHRGPLVASGRMKGFLQRTSSKLKSTFSRSKSKDRGECPAGGA